MTRTVAAKIAVLAARDPGRPAVAFEGRCVSRGELLDRAGRIAARLVDIGVAPGDRVAVLLDKSPDAVAGLLGAWLAGAAYVPLDPTGPPPRLSAILADSEPAALVTGATKRRKLDALQAEAGDLPPALVLGDADDEAALAGTVPLDTVRSCEDDPACLLYTSGSTGQPKGVVISHRNIAAFSDWAGDFFALREKDRVSAHAPLHFDLSLFDVWTTLAHGACVCLVPQGLSFLGVDLVRFVTQNAITVWQSVPSVLRLMVRHLEAGDAALAPLRLVFFAGEPFPPEALRNLRMKLPHTRMVNIYGSTEMNDVTFHEIGETVDDTPLPIGQPCSHMQVLVVDDAGAILSEAGAIGELCARGPTVALGYWRAGEATASRFVQHPGHDLFPDRVYRSGDLVEIGADGALRYVGRRDTQVKIRGNRVNLGEVEEALVAHPAIAEAAVTDVEDGEGDRSLKAFLVLASGQEAPDLRSLRRHCAGRLPAYMVPESAEFREGLPRTSTGKLDRQALRRVEAVVGAG
uniref:amino acid adenylation domain-containing protein n=1 Tax=Stappia sp. TaxID=1870903 RepID=UPI003BABE219